MAGGYGRIGVTLRAELAAMVDALLEGTAEGDAVELDAVGEAVGARAISQAEIDEVLSEIERRGRRVTSREGGRGEADLRAVLDVARALRAELGRPPRPGEIAERAGMGREDVQHALSLARIMQR